MRNDLPSGAIRGRWRRGTQNLAGKIAFIVGAAGPVLLIVAAVWVAINAVRYLVGIE
jgi:hypothetical protein